MRLLIVITLLLLEHQYFACDLSFYGNYNRAPKIYIENDKPKGILIEMMAYVAKDVNCNFTYNLSPWNRAYRSALNSEGGIIGFSKTKDRVKIFDYSDVMYDDNIMMISTVKGKFKYSTIKDLANKRIITNSGAKYGEEFAQAEKDGLFTLIEHTGDSSAWIKFVLLGRADVALISPNLSSLLKTIKEDDYLRENQDLLYIFPEPFRVDPNYLGFSKKLGMTEFLKKFNASVKKGIATGEFEKIIQKYDPHKQ